MESSLGRLTFSRCGTRKPRPTPRHGYREPGRGGLMPATAGSNPPRPVLLPSVFPSGRNVVDLKPILGLQVPDRVGHCGLILFEVGTGKVGAIALGWTRALQKLAVELVQSLGRRT